MEEIENKKNKYIYVRHNGIINKYIDDGKYYILTEAGIALKKEDNLFLGKMSENIIDLVEVGDFVNGVKVVGKYKFYDKTRLEMLSDMGTGYENEMFEEDIKTILTKEQYEANCYRLE